MVDDEALGRIEALADLASLREILIAALASLPPGQVDAIRLRVIDELPYAEVAPVGLFGRRGAGTRRSRFVAVGGGDPDMSYESVIDHMRRELVAGATRRRSRERMRRGLGAAVVAVAVVIATLALVRNNDHTTRLSTQPGVGPTAAQSEACYSFLDLSSSALAPGPAATAAIEQFASLAQASGDKTLAKIAATIRDNYPRETTAAPDEELGKKLGSAYKDVIDHCRAIGVPGFNPVYVPASTGPPPRVDLRTYGTEQSLTVVGDRLPEGATAPQGRDLSPVAAPRARRVPSS